MGSQDSSRRIVKYLTDVHSIELQALAQMRRAPRVASDPHLRELFVEHEGETQSHERLVRELLLARGAQPSRLKDLAGRVGGWAMIIFARLNPDSTGKLVAHGFSYEHMEYAAYELLRRFAERDGEAEVAETASRIGAQEAAMAERLRGAWSEAVEASLAEKGKPAPGEELTAYLRDVRALEAQSLQFLRASAARVKTPELREVLRAHEGQTREHQRLLDRRLGELDSAPSRLQDAALRASAIGIVGFFAAQPDTTVKLAGFAHALEAIEQAAYGLLATLARRAADPRTAELAERIMDEERVAGERVAGCWDAVVQAQASGG